MKKHLTPSLEALEDEQNSLFDFLEEAYMLSKLDSSYVNSLIGIGIKFDRKWTVNFNHLLHDRPLWHILTTMTKYHCFRGNS